MSNNKFWGNKEEVEKSMHIHAINNSITTGFCTFSVTGKTFVEQNWYHCMSCFPDDFHSGVCEVCVQKCHVGHDVSRNPKYSSFYCDCGAGETDCGTRNKFDCKCLAGKDATSSSFHSNSSINSYSPSSSFNSGSADSSHPTSHTANSFSISNSFNPGTLTTFSLHNFHPAAAPSTLNGRLSNTQNNYNNFNLPPQSLSTPPKINDTHSASLYLSELNRHKEASTLNSVVTNTTSNQNFISNLAPSASGDTNFINSLSVPLTKSTSSGVGHTHTPTQHSLASTPLFSSPQSLHAPSVLTTNTANTSDTNSSLLSFFSNSPSSENGVPLTDKQGVGRMGLKTSSSSSSSSAPSSSITSSLSSSSSSSSPPASQSTASTTSSSSSSNNRNSNNPPPSSSPPSGSVLSAAAEDHSNSLDPMMEESFSVENLTNKTGAPLMNRMMSANHRTTTTSSDAHRSNSTSSSTPVNEEDSMLIETTSNAHHTGSLLPSKTAMPMPHLTTSSAISNTSTTSSRSGTAPSANSSWMDGNHR
eukprot:TRINITY_DN572_c0_g2_i1.p1 TRINITY_DN572_c0_g2~~TRINITY_DN572_c0_g2_i1.p1  ORF type:complete len:530 (+),score=136.21 TRINITY_DN572_c0_g2_i1:497-2086(+)